MGFQMESETNRSRYPVRNLVGLIFAGLVLTSCAFRPPDQVSVAAAQKSTPTAIHKSAIQFSLPLRFEQAPDTLNADFLVRGAGYAASLDAAGIAMWLPDDSGRPQPVVLSWEGSNLDSATKGSNLLMRSNSFIGSDPARWRSDVPHYRRVSYEDIYPNIDVEFYENQRELEFDFVVAPGGDAESIRINIQGAQLRGDTQEGKEDGSVRLVTGDHQVVLHAPIVYQQAEDGARTPVAAQYRLLADNQLQIVPEAYDHTKTLVIDPVITYSSFYGGGGTLESAQAVATDDAGNIYLAGTTNALDFPLVNEVQSSLNIASELDSFIPGDLFVAKLDPTGTTVLFSTYLGSPQADGFGGLAVGADQSIYIAGNTFGRTEFDENSNSPEVFPAEFPTTANAFQESVAPQLCPDGAFGNLSCSSAYVARIAPAGNSLIWSTFLDGGDNETVRDISIDANGQVIVVGLTQSADFPVQDAVQAELAGFTNGFVSVLATNGDSLAFSTYLGGSFFDEVTSVDTAGPDEIVVTGNTGSADFPMINALQTLRLGFVDAFVTKLNYVNPAIVWSTFHGGLFDETGSSVAVGPQGAVYITGSTSSANFPTLNAVQPVLGGGGTDGFVSKLSSDGQTLEYSTFIGGPDSDELLAIVVDSQGAAHAAGVSFPTGSESQFPQVNPLSARSSSASNPLAIKLGPQGDEFVYATLLASSNPGLVNAVALDANDDLWIAGQTRGTDFPLVSAVIPRTALGAPVTVGGTADAFLTRIAAQPPAQTSNLSVSQSVSSASPVLGETIVYSYAVTNNGTLAATDLAVLIDLPGELVPLSVSPAVGSYSPATRVWSVPSLAVGAVATLTLDVVVDAQLSGEIVRINAIVFDSAPIDVTLADNTATAIAAAGGSDAFSRGEGLLASVLPTGRSVQVGQTATVYASMLHSPGPALDCSVEPLTDIPATFAFQRVDSLQTPLQPLNEVTSDFDDEAINYVLLITPSAPFPPTTVELEFSCDNYALPAAIFPRLNTLTLSASTEPVPDIIAVARTLTGDGIMTLPGGGELTAFAAAATNVGVDGEITVVPFTGGSRELNLLWCETDPISGVCINPLEPQDAPVRLTIENGARKTFTVFAAGAVDGVDFSLNRVFLRFSDDEGVERGATSVAVQ